MAEIFDPPLAYAEAYADGDDGTAAAEVLHREEELRLAAGHAAGDIAHEAGGARVEPGVPDGNAHGDRIEAELTELRIAGADGDLVHAGVHGEDVELGDLGAVLDEVDWMLARYVAFPTEQARWSVALWIAHTWGIDAFQSTPRLHFRSPEKQSGKTRAQEVAELLVHRPIAAANVTTAALFRSITDEHPPTLLLDEVDTIFGPKAPDGSEDLRGLLNAGHRRGKPILRCHGPNHDVKAFPSFTPVCLAGIGSLPDTIEDRSVTIEMRRRAPHEHVEPFRQRIADEEAEPIRNALEASSESLTKELTDFYPVLPPWLTDRPSDVWEPLIAVADIAGGHWPHRARKAAEVLLAERAQGDLTIGVRLLNEIRVVYGDEVEIHTSELLARLHALEESPWKEWDITARWLAGKLGNYGIKSKNIRIGVVQAKGYARSDFLDAWARYPFEEATLCPSGTGSDKSEVPSQASQASYQGKCERPSVPGTAVSVPRPKGTPSDQGGDGGTYGTAPRLDDFDDDLFGGDL